MPVKEELNWNKQTFRDYAFLRKRPAMKLYHYAAKGNTVLKDGILSLAQNPNAELGYYNKRSGATTHEGVVQWMENCFAGRSRGIRGFSEPIRWTENSLSLKEFVNNADMFSIDLDALVQDGLLEAVYVSPPIPIDPEALPPKGIGFTDVDEVLVKLGSIADISVEAVDWSVCNDKLGRRFAFVPYYLIIVKNGVIPPQYIAPMPKIMLDSDAFDKFLELPPAKGHIPFG